MSKVFNQIVNQERNIGKLMRWYLKSQFINELVVFSK